MKTTLGALLLALPLLLVLLWPGAAQAAAVSAASGPSQSEPGLSEQEHLAAASAILQQDPGDTDAIVAALDRGLAEHPASLPLLHARGDILCSRGYLAPCRANSQKILELRPAAIETRMLLCMLDELEQGEGESCRTCYRDVAYQYTQRPANSQQEIANNALNRVFALLLAGHPDGERERLELRARAVADPQNWLYHQLLEDFDRKKVLEMVFGPSRR